MGEPGSQMGDEVKVREWMHLGVITCTPETSAEDVAETMKLHDVSALVVVDVEGYAVGLISRTDLVNATFVQPYLRHWRGMAASSVMRKWKHANQETKIEKRK